MSSRRENHLLLIFLIHFEIGPKFLNQYMDHGSGSRVGRQLPGIDLFQLFCIYNSGIQVWCQDFEHVGAVFLIGTKPLKR